MIFILGLIHTSPGAACMSDSDLGMFSSFKSQIFQKFASRATGTFLVSVNLQDFGASGDSGSNTTSSCQTDETQSWLMVWLIPRLFKVLPTRWQAVFCADVSRSAGPPRVMSGAFPSTCFVVNPPVRLCTASYRGQSKECKRGSQSGHKRANQSFMDFPVKDTQRGSPSSRCGSRLEVFLCPSVSIEVLCTMTLKIQDKNNTTTEEGVNAKSLYQF